MLRNTSSKVIAILILLTLGSVSTAFSQVSETEQSSRHLSFGLGYQYFSWNYDSIRRFRTGTLEVIHQNSYYHALVAHVTFRAFKPWGLLASVDISFPFSITESVYFPQVKSNDIPRVVKDGLYMLKNIPMVDVLKGLGITAAVGVNYNIGTNPHTGNVGLSLAWVTFTEDLYGRDKQNRTSSMLGLMLAGDYQYAFSKGFGISLGAKISYYPIALFSINNLIGYYSIKTVSMVECSISIAPVFYF